MVVQCFRYFKHDGIAFYRTAKRREEWLVHSFNDTCVGFNDYLKALCGDSDEEVIMFTIRDSYLELPSGVIQEIPATYRQFVETCSEYEDYIFGHWLRLNEADAGDEEDSGIEV